MIFKSFKGFNVPASYLGDRTVRWSLGLSFLINLSLWLFLSLQAKNFTNLMPLHYNIYFGIDRLGLWHELFFLPALGLAFIIINLILARLVYYQEKILSYFLVVACAVLQVILILASIFITLINY